VTEYTYPVDVANRALIHNGISPNIVSSPVGSTVWTGSKNAVVMSFLYDKIRQAMLREYIWNFTVVVAPLVLATTVVYPDGNTRNVFSYPTGYVRPANQDARAQGTVQQRTSGGIQYTGLDFIAAGIVSTASTLSFAYVSDITTVTTMDVLFIEAFGARLAMAALPALTQSVQKLQQIEPVYLQLIERAIEVSAIEAGNMEPTGKDLKMERLNIQLLPQQPRGQNNG
jgi:hypothetical protein